MSELTPERLAEIKARTEKATPGPWTTHDLSQPVGGQTVTVHSESGPRAMTWTVELPPEIGGMVAAPDAVFIAHAREDVPALVAEVERLRSERNAAWSDSEKGSSAWAKEYTAHRATEAERDALQAKLDKVRAWSEERSMLTASGKLVSGVPGLSAILDGKEQDDD